jgi:hypothetical protein
VAEAEDIILEAAERVGHAARGLWRRGAVGDELGFVRAIEARRRLDLWLSASFSESWAIEAVDAPAAPHWLLRALGRPAPWQLTAAPSASTDGVRLFLPRPWLEGDPSDVLLSAALGLGWRLAHGRAAPLADAGAVARDAHHCLEGASADAWLARRLPGLVPRLEGVRRRAPAGGPPL